MNKICLEIYNLVEAMELELRARLCLSIKGGYIINDGIKRPNWTALKAQIITGKISTLISVIKAYNKIMGTNIEISLNDVS